jgi:tol-pal system protein YbgF
VVAAATIAPRTALAQGSFLNDIFGGSQRLSPEQDRSAGPQGGVQTPAGPQNRVAQGPAGELTTRLDRLEAQIRQLTGAIEQLQYRNQQLELQLQRMRSGEGAVRVPLAPQQGQIQPQAQPPVQSPPAPPPGGGRRGEVFDPAQNPNAPGAPRVLGTLPSGPSGPVVQANPNVQGGEVGAPGGRGAGAPLDLSTLAAAAANDRGLAQPGYSQPGAAANEPAASQRGPATGAQVATLPPSDSPRDNYDLAYGYLMRKDYALAEQGFRNFLSRFPSERLVPDAQYWLGESLFQRQRYRDAAEMFLAVSTKYETNARAPDSLLRLGQSLAAMGEREAACASLAEVLRKYPRASVAIRQGVEREQKRVRC